MESRTKNAVNNVKYAMIYQIFNLVLKFVVRTVFVYALGKEYLGVSGVFTNILSILNLTELGIGTSIIHDMYRPIADNDTKRVTQLVAFYKKIYFVIGIIVMFLGLLIFPWIDRLIKDVPNINHINIIYLMFLFQSACSYFFAQYTSLIRAYQKNYIVVKINILVSVIKSICECLWLIVFGNYIIYLILEIVSTIAGNYLIYRKAIKMFPFILDKVELLEQRDIKKIVNNALCNFSNKVGATAIGATDNILMSTIISTVVVGVYSNYSLIVTTVLSATLMLREGLIAGIGNVCATEGIEKKYIIYRRIFFAFSFIYAIISCEMIAVMQSFFLIWLGNDYILPLFPVIIIINNCYLQGVHQPIEIFISTDGLFKYFKIIPWITAIINMGMSIFLGKKMGIAGILLGTTISSALTFLWYDGYIIFKYSFNKKVGEYLSLKIKHYIVAIIACAIMSIITKHYMFSSLYIDIIIKGCLALVIVGLLFLLFFSHDQEFIFWKKTVSKYKLTR